MHYSITLAGDLQRGLTSTLIDRDDDDRTLVTVSVERPGPHAHITAVDHTDDGAILEELADVWFDVDLLLSSVLHYALDGEWISLAHELRSLASSAL